MLAEMRANMVKRSLEAICYMSFAAGGVGFILREWHHTLGEAIFHIALASFTVSLALGLAVTDAHEWATRSRKGFGFIVPGLLAIAVSVALPKDQRTASAIIFCAGSVLAIPGILINRYANRHREQRMK